MRRGNYKLACGLLADVAIRWRGAGREAKAGRNVSADRAQLRRSGAVLDHREVAADGDLADLERGGFAGLPIGGGGGLVEGGFKLGMVRDEGSPAEISGRVGHLSHR